MKTCYVDPRTCSIADLCDAREMGLIGTLITRINVPEPHRGNGHGSALLREICMDADTEQVNLWLEIHASDGRGVMNYDKLVAWYERHGFKFSTIIPTMMVRRPRK